MNFFNRQIQENLFQNGKSEQRVANLMFRDLFSTRITTFFIKLEKCT